LGYTVAQTYYEPKLYKTDAPPEVVYDIYKQIKIQQSGGDSLKLFKNVPESSPAFRILSKKPEVNPSFNEEEVTKMVALQKQKARYLPNPAPNWGPKARATGKKE